MHPENLKISVLVPTSNRPGFLRNTLQSIALQSARCSIGEVIVSENSHIRDSEDIVSSFRDELPIQWIQQAQLLTAQQHGIWLSSQAQFDLVAQIADDDIWDRYHLEEALRCFYSQPSIAAYFGQAVRVDNQACQPFDRFSGTFDHLLSSNEQPVQDFIIWDQITTSVNSLAGTPLNIWAVVARREAHAKALLESAGHEMFGAYPANDSLYVWRLSYSGLIAVGRHIGLFYRVHQGSDIQSAMQADYIKTVMQDFEIRQEISRQSEALGIHAVHEWRQEHQRAQAQGLSHRICIGSSTIASWLLPSTKTNQAYGGSHLKQWAKQLLPPIMYQRVSAALRRHKRKHHKC